MAGVASGEQMEVLIELQRKLIEEQRETNELLTRIIELCKHRLTVRCKGQ
jgi:hypothetical protein